MPTTVRATIIQPDPKVPLDRFAPWLASNRVLLRAYPLWSRDVPRVEDVADGLLVLGGRMSVRDSGEHPWIDPLKGLLAEAVAAGVPTLAICLGHQLLAEALGGEVVVDHPDGGEHGPFPLNWEPAARHDPLLGRVAEQGPSLVAQSHHDAVITLPPGAESLASTELYPNQAFRVGSAVGVQFHPEASPELMGRWAELKGAEGRDLRRTMHRHDTEVSRTGRLLAQAFCGQLRARALAA